MQHFKCNKSDEIWSFDDDVITEIIDGVFHFKSAEGELLSAPSTLEPCEAPIEEDQFPVIARITRNRLLTLTDWLVTRHRDEIDLKIQTTLTIVQFKDLLVYRNSLRETAAPALIIPEFLKGIVGELTANAAPL